MGEPDVEVAFPTSSGPLEDQAAETIPKVKGSEEMTLEKMNSSTERKDEEEHGKGSEEMKASEDRKGRGEIDKVLEEMEVPKGEEPDKGPEEMEDLEEEKDGEPDKGPEEMEDPEEEKDGEPDEGPEEMTVSEERKDGGPDKDPEDGEQDKGPEEMKDITERDDAEGKGKYPGEMDFEERKVKEDDEKNGVRREEADEGEEEILKDDVEMAEALDAREEEMDYGERKDGEVKDDDEESGGRREETDEGEEEETEKEDVEKAPTGDAKDEEKAAEGGEEEEGEKPWEDNDVVEEKDSGDEEKKVTASKDRAVPKKKKARGGRVSSNGHKMEKNERVVNVVRNISPTVKAEPLRTPAPSSMERPVRERKTVERLVQVIDKEQTKEFQIEKGRGTQLKDIPNVAYKLSKKKSADLKLLHQTLFGRRGKVINFKNHILQFSGFALHEDEEKQKTKMKEKLEKYVKDVLLDFCDLFDIHVLKATTRKEDIVAKLVDFMVAPHATTDVILAEKDQSSKSRKRKRVSRSTGGTSEKSPSKKRAKDEDTPNTKSKRAEESEDEEDEKDDQNELSDENESPKHSDNDEKKDESDEEDEDADEPPKKRQQVKKTSSGNRRSDKKEKRSRTSPVMVPPKSVRSPAKSPSTKHQAAESNDTGEKVFSRKRKAIDAAAIKSSSKPDNKERVTGKRSSTVKVKSEEAKQFRPTKDELRAAICKILKEINFNTATFNDMFHMLSRYFKTNLTPRKSVIKDMIKEELTKLAEEAADADADADEEEDADADADADAANDDANDDD